MNFWVPQKSLSSKTLLQGASRILVSLSVCYQLRNFRFSQRCCWRFVSSAMWEREVHSVPKDRTAFTFRVKHCKRNATTPRHIPVFETSAEHCSQKQRLSSRAFGQQISWQNRMSSAVWCWYAQNAAVTMKRSWVRFRCILGMYHTLDELHYVPTIRDLKDGPWFWPRCSCRFLSSCAGD